MGRPYAIAAVAKITGLSVDTLRAWERRYAIVTPERDAKGTRRYTEAAVARLELARSATSLGHPIRHVAKLSDEQLRAMVQRSPEDDTDTGQPVVQKVLQSIRRYDLFRAEELLAAAAIMLQPQNFVMTVISPLMTTVGRLWEQRSLSIAQEHLVSVLVRNLLGSLMRLRPPHNGSTMLFATPPNEPHEFGIAIAACLASMRGLRACVLGANVPAQEVTRAARYLNPRIIVIGATLAETGVDQYIATIRARMPRRTQIWLGGHACGHGLNQSHGVERVPTFPDFCGRVDRELQ